MVSLFIFIYFKMFFPIPRLLHNHGNMDNGKNSYMEYCPEFPQSEFYHHYSNLIYFLTDFFHAINGYSTLVHSDIVINVCVVHICVHMCVEILVHTCVCGSQRLTSVSCPVALPSYFFEGGFLNEPGVRHFS